MPKHNKKITLSLVGLDGNAYSLMGAFQRQAKRERWTKEEIDQVLNKAMAGNYDDLIVTLMEYCEDEIEDDDFEDYE